MNTVTRITEVLVHPRPHLDEITGDWLLRRFGREKFPGVENATLLFEGAANAKMLGESAEELEAKGAIALGRWGSRFDEHPSVDRAGTPDRCTADLVAEDLGIDQRPELLQLLQFVRKADLKAAGHQLDLACMVKTMHSVHRDDPMRVIDWARLGIDAKYQQALRGDTTTRVHDSIIQVVDRILADADQSLAQRARDLCRSDNQPFGLGRVASAIHTQNPKEAAGWITAGFNAVFQKQLSFNEAKKIVAQAQEEIVVQRGITARIIFARTDHEEFSAAARAMRAAIVIQQQPSGNVQIYTNKDRRKLGFGMDMARVAHNIRMEEQMAKRNVLTTDMEELRAEGTVDGAEEWYFHLEGQMLLNGSLTTINNPTNLPLEEIVDIVKRSVILIPTK